MTVQVVCNPSFFSQPHLEASPERELDVFIFFRCTAVLEVLEVEAKRFRRSFLLRAITLNSSSPL